MSTSIASVLNLVGVTSLLGSDVAKNSLKFINIDEFRIFTSFLVIPGIYSVATQMLKRSNNKLALIFSSGDREDKKSILGFKSNYKYKYIGMQSGTNANIGNVLIEGWLNKKNKEKGIQSKIYKDGLRATKIGIIKLDKKNDKEFIKNNDNLNLMENAYKSTKINKKDILNNFFIKILSLFTQIGSFVMLILTILEKDIVSYIILILNMLSYFLLIIILNKEKYIIPDSKPSISSPPGNAIVMDNNGNNIWIVLGTEKEIQDSLQLELKTQDVNEYISIIISVFVCITSVITILLTPIMSDKGKIYYSVNLLIGLLSALLFSSRDTELILGKLAEKHYNFNETRIINFTNRASAIAYSFLNTKGYQHQLGNLIPNINEWIHFRNILSKINSLNNVEVNDLFIRIKNVENIQDMKKVLINNFDDAKIIEKSGLGDRLLEDILEALIELSDIDIKIIRNL
jgi:ligand-binding sensor protein